MIKRIGSLVLIASLAVVVAACGTGDGASGDPESITIATGGTGGVYYPLGGGLAQIFKDKLGVTSTATATGASVENMQLISKGEVQVAFTQNDIADYAVKGIEVFDAKLENISGIAALYPEIIQLVVAEDSGINSLADLKGKKVSVGAPGSGNEANSIQILTAAGLSYDDVEEELKSYADSADAFKDGLIDAMFVTSGVPNSSVSDIAVTKGVKVLNMDEDVITKLKKDYPFYIDAIVPKDSYKGQTEDAKTVAVLASLVVNSKLSDDFVYKMTKTLFENVAELGAKHVKGKEISLDKALQGLSIPIHPGAQKYYDEQGIK